MKFFKQTIAFILIALTGYLLYVNVDRKDIKTKTDRISETLRSAAENEEYERENNAKPDEPDKFAEYLMLLKTGMSGKTYEGNYKLRELKKAKLHLSELKKATVTLDWKERGPGNVGGRTRSIVVDPKDASGETWIAGSVSGGVWRTLNAGKTWRCISPGLVNLATGTISMSKDDPNVIYTGTGEGFYNIDAVTGAGIFKSIDNGKSWEQLKSTKDNSNFYYVNRIITDPGDVDNVIAATNKGVFRSVDGGESWEQTLTGKAQQIIFEKDDFKNQYVTINGRGIYKSVDGGETWFKVKIITEGRIEMAIAEGNSNVVYALTSESNLYMSTDGGYNWALNKEDSKTDFLGGQGWYNNSLVVSPLDSNILFIGGIDVHKVVVDSDDVASGGSQAFDINVQDSEWLRFANFGGGYLGGGFKVNIETSVYWDTSIDLLGDSTQKAHRFVYENGVYVFKDFVDIPFSVTKNSDNVKLNVSFIDDNQNGKFDLTESGKEYIYIHYTDYTGLQVEEIAKDNGLNVKNMYVLLPVMQPGQVWDPENLSSVKISVDNHILKGKKMTSEKKTIWHADVNSNTYAHADHHGLVIDLNNGAPFRLIDVSDGGIAFSDDGGEKWSSPIKGYVTSQFYSVAKHPVEDRYLGGMQDNGTWVSSNSPDNLSEWKEALGGDGFGSAWHSRKPEQMIASLYYNQLYRTDDNWEHLYEITKDIPDAGDNSDAPFLTTVASSQDDPDMIFIAGTSGLWRSDNFGIKWTNVPINSHDYGYNKSSVYVEISKADPKVIWAGVKMSSSGKLNLSTNKGRSFTAVNNYVVDIKYISRVVSHPIDPNTVYVLNSAPESPKIIRSTDMGQTWEDITGFGENSSSSNGFPDVATYTMLVMPYNTDILWAGTEIGLFISEDNGKTWHYSDNGLPAVSIWDMKIVGDQVVLGTHGRGIWSVTIPELRNILSKPYLTGTGVTPDNRFMMKYEVAEDYDSLAYFYNDVKAAVKTNVSTGINDIVVDIDNTVNDITSQIVGYKDGTAYRSNAVITKAVQYKLPRVRYFNDFDIHRNDFFGNGFEVNNRFENNYAINTSHPYPESDDLIYVLKYPVVVMDDEKLSVMTYEDIAFIEKGEPESVFGDDDFYDYVIVEGSKDGIEWKAMADGYDFRYSGKWGDNVDAKPKGYMFVSHSINFQDTFNAGDTILIRFRLFSDPYTTGWGWIIDNVNIQKDGSGIFNRADAGDGELTVSPNPATDHVNIMFNDTRVGTVSVKVYDLGGQLLFEKEFKKYQQKWQMTLPVDDWGRGIKIINVGAGKYNYSKRILVK
jgi:photosystem II stability/assembly factor-like uncharacterized protein